MIEQLASKTSNPPFSNSVLPGAAVAGTYGTDPRGVEELTHLGAELRVSIEDQGIGPRRLPEMLREVVARPIHWSGARSR